MAGSQIPYVLSLILFNLFAAEAQSPKNGDNSNSNNPGYFQSANFNPSMAIIIVVLISAFFFLGFFSIYLRQCGSGRIESIAATAAAAVGGRSRRQRGLDPSVLEAFPALVYSEVKEHKIGKGALECAICLNEFDDEDAIRLLPRCDHVFHQECIDAWLATHVTCPVCRTNYALVPDDLEVTSDAPAPAEAPEALPVSDPPPPATDQVMITVGDEERKQEMRELARIATRMRGNRSRRLPRSHSTGHSLQGDERDRYTLRLPENVRKEIMAAGRLQRARSVAVEGSSRRGRSVRLGRSDRWPSFFTRSLSARFPAWVNWRRADEGSSAKEGSVRASKYAAGSSIKPDSNVELEEEPAAALNRV